MNVRSLTPSETKDWLEQNKVCIVTNSTLMPGSLFLHSLQTYINYIPANNFMIIPGIGEGGKPNYGLSAFVQMINVLTSEQYKNVFDYVIYIDEDCFIKNFNLLLVEFERFKNFGYCLGGMPDGGVICHRNQSRILVNTFLSFWNLKELRQNITAYANNYNVLMQSPKPYKAFFDILKKRNSKLYDTIDQLSKDALMRSTKYRIKNFKQDPPHATIVKDDPSNPWDQHQVPYSFKGTFDENVEPYYLIEESILGATELPIYYLFATDLYVNEETKLDNSGITTVVMDSETCEHIAYHTWFARKYRPFNTNIQDIKKHVDRINSIIESTLDK